MRRRRAVMTLAAAAALCCVGPLAVGCAAHAGAGQVPAGAAGRAGAWHAAIEVPGTGALNKGGNAAVTTLSCASAGNCAAAGQYTDGSGHTQAFVASQTSGTWHAAIELPGTAALNAGGFAEVLKVACASAGNCAAGGRYTDGSGRPQAFVASQTSGTWHAAIELPGTAALSKGGGTWLHLLSCASAGNCTAGGFYNDQENGQAFVASEAGGAWHAAIEVPGTAALNAGGGGGAEVAAVSCASAGNCAAGGFYTLSSSIQAFVASEANGAWHGAVRTAALNKGAYAGVVSVSCGSVRNCAAGGRYTDGSGHTQAFVASEANGAWLAAIEVPGTGALNKGGSAGVISVSCASAAGCAAGGSYTDRSGHHQAFVTSQN